VSLVTLLRFGADPTHRNRVGQTAVDKARARGLDDLADLLSIERV
jgi:hypothetical protein